MCVFTVKSVCLLNAALAFNKVILWTLYSQMIKRNVLLVIVRIIAFWYPMHPICVKWGKFTLHISMFQMVAPKLIDTIDMYRDNL